MFDLATQLTDAWEAGYVGPWYLSLSESDQHEVSMILVNRSVEDSEQIDEALKFYCWDHVPDY